MATTGQSKSRYLEQALLNAALRGAAFPAAAGVYYGLYTTKVWSPNTAYVLGDLVVPINTNGHIYKCTTAGTSGASEPVWATLAGGTNADGPVNWTDQTLALESNTLGAEVTGNAYARQAVTFSAPVGGANEGSTVTQSANVAFPTPSPASWGAIVGFGIYDAASAGNLLYYAIFNTGSPANVIGPGSNFTLTNATTVTED